MSGKYHGQRRLGGYNPQALKELNTTEQLALQTNKEVKDLYSKSYKILVKIIEDGVKKWKDIPYSWIGKIKLVKMVTLSKASCIYSAIPLEIPKAFFTEL